MSKCKAISVGLVTALSLAFIYRAIYGDRRGEAKISSSILEVPRPESQTSAATSNSPTNQNQGTSNRGVEQDTPIDKFCPRLTTEEEDLLLEKSGRSPDVLGALALLQSTRSAEFVDEALRKNPNHVPALWAAAFLEDNFKKRLEQAEHLCAMELGQTAPLLAAGRLSARLKDKAKALAYLKSAAEKPQFQGRAERWADLMAKQYLAAGRTPEQANIRAQLETTCPETNALLNLGKLLGMREWNFHKQELVEPQIHLLAVIQKVDENPLFDAPSKSYAAASEEAALTSLLQATTVDSSKYLAIPLEEALGEAERHLVDIRKLSAVNYRVDEVFERLSTDERSQFLNLSKTAGQVGALLWVRENNPEALILPPRN